MQLLWNDFEKVELISSLEWWLCQYVNLWFLPHSIPVLCMKRTNKDYGVLQTLQWLDDIKLMFQVFSLLNRLNTCFFFNFLFLLPQYYLLFLFFVPLIYCADLAKYMNVATCNVFGRNVHCNYVQCVSFWTNRHHLADFLGH